MEDHVNRKEKYMNYSEKGLSIDEIRNDRYKPIVPLKKCPKCGSSYFYVTWHVAQTVEVDGAGNFIKQITYCDDVDHPADDDDLWTCAKCGYDAEGRKFNSNIPVGIQNG